MALTITYDFYNSDTSQPVLEKTSKTLRRSAGLLTLDSSYVNTSIANDGTVTTGGYDCSPISNDFGHLADMQVTLDTSSIRKGYSAAYNRTTNKLQIFMNAPPIVFEEVVDCDADSAKLRWPAAHILYISSSTATAHKVIPGTLTPAAGQVAVNMGFSATAGTKTDGCAPTMTFPTGEGAAATYITYITQAWKDVWDNAIQALIDGGSRSYGHADLAISEVGGVDKLMLGELAIAIQSVLWDDAGTYKACDALLAAATAATTEVAIDFTDNVDATETSLEFLASDTVDAAADAVWINYIKKPTSGFLSDRFVEADGMTPSSDICTASAPYAHALIYGSCGNLQGDTLKFVDMLRSGATLGTTATNGKITKNLWVGAATAGNLDQYTLGSDHGDGDLVTPNIVWGHPSEIETVPLECPSGTDLSNVKVYYTATGRSRQ